MKRALLAITCLFAGTIGSAQPANMDSLLSAWSDTTADFKSRAGALLLAFEQDCSLTVLKAVRAAVPGIADTTSRAFVGQRALAAMAWGVAHIDPDRPADRVSLLRKSLKDFERSGYTDMEAQTAYILGGTFGELGQYGAAVPYYLQALQGFEALRDTTGTYQVLAMIAFTYVQLDDHERSRLTYLRCLRMAEGRDTQQEFNALIRLASNFRSTMDTAEQRGYLQRAEALVQQGRAEDVTNEVAMCYAFRHLDEGDCGRALARLEQTLRTHQAMEMPAPGWISFLLGMKAKALVCAHRYKEAIALGKEGLQMANELGLIKEKLDNLRPLAAAYEAIGDVRQALLYTQRYHALKDSASTAASASQLAGAMLTFDFEKQQFADSVATAAQRAQDRLVTEQEVQRQRTQRNVLLGFGAFGLAFAAVDYRRRRRIKQEHARSEALLLNILPQEVAEELKSKGHAEAKHFDNVTILFSDFKGFTEASEKLSPQELVEELNTCFKAFDNIITARGIEKIKTIGDAYMCAGGLPDPKSSTPADVVHAALEMQAFMTDRKKERDAQGKPFFEMRVGIHTGPVVAGIVGVKKFQYDIWGDTVNTASRMESSGEVGKVNISEATYRAVNGEWSVANGGSDHSPTPIHHSPAFVFTPRGKVQAKGKGEMEMYFVRRSPSAEPNVVHKAPDA